MSVARLTVWAWQWRVASTTRLAVASMTWLLRRTQVNYESLAVRAVLSLAAYLEQLSHLERLEASMQYLPLQVDPPDPPAVHPTPVWQPAARAGRQPCQPYPSPLPP